MQFSECLFLSFKFQFNILWAYSLQFLMNVWKRANPWNSTFWPNMLFLNCMLCKCSWNAKLFMNQIYSTVETEKVLWSGNIREMEIWQCTRCDDGSVWMWAGARSDSCYCEVMMSSQAQHIPTHLWLLSGQRAQSTTVITHQIWRYATWWCPKATENNLLLLQKTFWHFKGIVLHLKKKSLTLRHPKFRWVCFFIGTGLETYYFTQDVNWWTGAVWITCWLFTI